MQFLLGHILLCVCLCFALGAEPACKDYEIFNPCPERCTFDPTCESLFQGIRPPCLPPSEDDQCEPRCECKPDLVRIGDDCVSADTCCEGENEVAVDCPAECDFDTNGELIKDCICFEKACRCRPNFVRDIQGKCVSLDKKCLGENEIYKDCGTCEGTCDNPNPICLQVCRPGCFCKDDHVRQNGTCIPIDACACEGPHEVYKSCGTCDGTCLNPDPICPQVCVAGCFCEDGFVRDASGECVDLYLCDDDDDDDDDDEDGTIFRNRRCFKRRSRNFRKKKHRSTSIGSIIRWLKWQIACVQKYCTCP